MASMLEWLGIRRPAATDKPRPRGGRLTLGQLGSGKWRVEVQVPSYDGTGWVPIVGGAGAGPHDTRADAIEAGRATLKRYRDGLVVHRETLRIGDLDLEA